MYHVPVFSKILRGADKVADAARAGAKATAKATCCFVAGTLVMTDQGLRPIEDIEVGDKVLARDEATGETALKPVTQLIRRHNRVIWKLTLGTTGEDGKVMTAVFGTTDDHPWRSVAGTWLKTMELKPGTEIQRARGPPARVVSIENTGMTQPTFNLEVADYHTYFVGEQQAWVHNACPITGRPQETKAGGQTTTHGSTSGRLAKERAETPGAAKVTQNQTLRTATDGQIDSDLRPDVATVFKDADGNVTAVHVDEVLSPGQTPAGQAAHYEKEDPRIKVQSHKRDSR